MPTRTSSCPASIRPGSEALLEPHGRVEDMEVHGQLVGVRLYPRDRGIRGLAPAGIELTPPRAERSTGPGHRDFAIVSDASITLEEDMARRDFTINAMAIRLDGGDLLDPFGGVADLERRELRTVGPTSFADDPLRLVRALRFVSQLGFDLAPETRAQMEANVHGLAHVSAERIGGGIKADGLGELSKLLLGREPATGAPARPGHRSADAGDSRVRRSDRLHARFGAAAAAARGAHLRRRPERRRGRCLARGAGSRASCTISASRRRRPTEASTPRSERASRGAS